MNNTTPEAKEVFLSALDCTSPEDLTRYLDEACRGDATLRERVEELLLARRQAGSFLGGRWTSATEELAIAESPGTVIGPYKLLQQIGEGGMGVVFMAEQTEPIQRTVALKIIKPGMDTRQVIARFEAERQALALMDHPNIARVLDAGATDTGRPYFVMDLVKGVPITDYCDTQHLSVRQRLELMAAVCQAVQHAHQKGIIHRDIKPSNVLVAEYDGKPVPKVIDFGVAKATAQRLTERTMFTQYGQIVGTFEYMSPEQARFNQLDVDTRSDIYSLGVLLYEVLAGSTPLEKERLRSAAYDEVLRIICEEEPPRPSTRLSSSQSLPSIAANRHTEPARLSKEVRGELDWIVMKCLEKDRNRRYETANGLGMDLQRYLHDEAVTACPPSAGYRLRKFVRRNKAALAIAVMILFLFVLLGGGVGWTMRDRAVRQAALEQGVTAALADVKAWHQRENWPEAMAAIKRAEGLLAAGQQSPDLSARVAQWRTDLETAAQFETIRLSDNTSDQATWRARPALHADYQRAFGSIEIDIDSASAEDVAVRIRARPIRDQLIAALDGWTKLRIILLGDNSELARDKPSDWRWRPLAVARAADTDEFRNRVRLAVGQGDQAALLELAQSPEAVRLPASTLELLVHQLKPSEINQMGREMDLLKRAQQARPDDFYINYALAASKPDQSRGEAIVRLRRGAPVFQAVPGNDLLLGDEAFVYAMAAVSLRPRNAYARAVLATTLERSGQLDDALAAYRDAIRLAPDLFAAYDRVGLILIQQGKIDEAVAIYRKLIELQPDDSDTYNHFGVALSDQGKLDDAIAAYHKAIELAPTYTLPWVNLGVALQDQGKLEDAIAADRKAIELDPDDASAHYNLGSALNDQGKLDEAITALRKATELAPDGILAANIHSDLGNVLRSQGKLDEAVAAYRKAIELAPDLAEAYFALGTVVQDQGKLDDAVAAYRKAIELKPDDSKPYNNLGNILSSRGKLDEAIAAFRKAMELDPDDSIALNNFGNLRLYQGRLDEAIVAFRKAIELAPQNASPHNNLGSALRDQGKLDEAVGAIRKAIELKPDYAVAYDNLGETLHGLGKFEESITAFRTAIEFKPDFAEAYNGLGVVLLDCGKLDDAVAAYRKSLELDPQYAPGYANLGWALQQQGKLDDAVVAYRKAIELEPTIAEAYLNLGDVLQKQGKFDEAVASFRKPIELKLESSVAYLSLGVALKNQGDIEEAIAAYRKAIDLQPDHYAAYNNLAGILATAPAPHRDPERALELATRATELAPTEGAAWNTLGIARYRVGELQPAIAALTKSMELRDGGDANDWFFLAMAHWRLGHKDDARTWYDKSVEWMEKNQPQNEELRRYRAEAAELLGIPEP